MTGLYGRPLFGDLIRCYGCVKCQAEHREFDPEFEGHLPRQSKHGVYERGPRDMGERFAFEFHRITTAESQSKGK